MMRFIKFSLIFLLFPFNFFSQGYIDTLKAKLDKAGSDSLKLETIHRFLFRKKLSAASSDSMLRKMEELGKKNGCRLHALSLVRIGIHAENSGKEDTAMRYFLASLKMAESCNYTAGKGLARQRLGMLNLKMENYKVAISDFELGAGFSVKAGDRQTLGDTYSQLGVLFKEKGNIDSSLFYTQLALEIFERLGNKKSVANCLNNLGLAYKRDKNYDMAVVYLTKALEMRKEIGDKKGEAGASINISNCYRELKKYKEGIEFAKKGTYLAQQIKEGEFFRNGLKALGELSWHNGDFKGSAYYYRRHDIVDDSINLMKVDKNLQELQEKYESDKKDNELKEKENSLKLAGAKNSLKNLLITFSFVALGLAVIAAVFIFRSYRQSKKSANDLRQKNLVIAEKNKEITDSINYARNIQQSLLTSENLFKENFREHFILYLPKDIVSGDFYWAEKNEEGISVMCADCTGHGVPGAFMSLLGIGFLNEITYHSRNLRPDQVLNQLRNRLIEAFEKNNNRDGMDGSLIRISGGKLEMAAANNPVWVIRKGVNLPVKADKFPIGRHHGEMKDFSYNEMELQENDLLVMFTDGYADQFGGPENKKFKYKRLEKLVLENAGIPLAELREKLWKSHQDWKGANEQIDDVCIIGIRL